MKQVEIDHLAGKGVVVKAYYADPSNPGMADVTTRLPTDDELGLWADAAFTNGGPLVKIEMVWAPAEAKKLAVMAADNG